MSETFTAYANWSEPPTPLVSENTRLKVAAGLAQFLDGSRELDDVVSGILADADRSKDRLLSEMHKNQTLALKPASS